MGPPSIVRRAAVTVVVDRDESVVVDVDGIPATLVAVGEEHTAVAGDDAQLRS